MSMCELNGVTAVVLNWNDAKSTQKCLRSLVPDLDSGLKVLVVDNGSTDGSPSILRSIATDGVEVVCLTKNAGFCGGMNVGIDTALSHGARYVWLLNNDTEVQQGCLRSLLRALEKSDDALVVSPRLLGPDGVEQAPAGHYSWDGSQLEMQSSSHWDADSRGAWLSGAALLVPAKVARRVGGFDDRLFAYWEDVAWCADVVSAGFGLRLVMDATVVHYGSVATGGAGSPLSSYLMARNEVLLLRERGNTGSVRRALRRWCAVGKLTCQRGWPATGRAFIAGAMDGAMRQSGPPLPSLLARAAGRLVEATPWRALR